MWLRMERLPEGLHVQIPDEGGRATMLTYLTNNALKVSGANLPPGRGRTEFALICSRCHASRPAGPFRAGLYVFSAWNGTWNG
jgi:hypothetical protein